MPAPGDLLADRYRLGPLLGVGGMATVHRAHDERLDRDVAIKVLLPNLAADPALARRFDREARAMAAVADPALVAVFDVDPGDPAAGREPFVVMELCPGGSLANRLGPDRPMSPDELIPILVAVTGGLAALHRAGLVHRDVKPSNILFATDRVKLGDFGLARSQAEVSELTQPGTAIGTLGYLAPERLRGEAGDAASDVYALGTVAFLGLTGQMPRPSGSVRDVVAAAALRPPPVSGAAPGLGTAFDEPIADALATDPARRPDALDLGSSLGAALGRWSRSGRPGAGGALAAAGAAASAPPVPSSLPAAAAGSPAAPADDATTAVAMPVDATASILVPPSDHRPGPPRSSAAGPASRAAARPRSSGGASRIAALVVALLIVAGLALYLRACQTIQTLPSGIPASASAAPVPSSPAPSRSPSVAPSPSLIPSQSPSVPAPSSDPAVTALDNVEAAIAAARGGPDGLKGKDANALESLAGRVRRDLANGDRRAAMTDARELDRRARDIADHLDDQMAARLTRATGHLVDVLRG